MRLYTATLFLIVFAFAAVTGFIGVSNRIENDAAFHALVSREIAEKQTVIGSTSYILAGKDSPFPVAYPVLFHLTGAILYLFAGNDAFLILPVVYGMLSLYFLGMLLRLFPGMKSAGLLGLFLLSVNPLFINYASQYYMETALVAAVLAALYFSVKFSSSGSTKDLFTASVFYGLTLAFKQQGFFLIPVFLVVLVRAYLRMKSLKTVFISVTVFLFVVTGPLVRLFVSTGSMLYAGDNAPRIVDMVEKPLRAALGIRVLPSDPEWPKLNSGRRADELSRFRTLRAVTTGWITEEDRTSLPWDLFAAASLVIVLFRIIRLRPFADTLILSFIAVFGILFYVLARPRYTLPLIIIPSLIASYFLATTRKLLPARKPLALVVLLFVVYGTVTLADRSDGLFYRDSFGYLGRFMPGRDKELADLYARIRADGDSGFSVLSPLPYETAFYTGHVTVWANPYGSTGLFAALLSTDERAALREFRAYKARYLIVYADRLMPYANWAGIAPSDGLLGAIDGSPNFRKIATNNSGSVYRIVYDGL